MTAPVITEQDRLSLQIGATEERIHRILRDLECATFAKSTQDKVTQMWADLDGLYGELEALLAAEAAVA